MWYTSTFSDFSLAETEANRHILRMPPEKKFDAQIHLTISTDMLKRVDRWRAAQADVPNRSEAIRRMVQIVLDQQSPNG